jgi:hypothetical protein
MRHRIEPQSRLKQLAIELQGFARIWGAGIGDDKPDVDIVRDRALLWEPGYKTSTFLVIQDDCTGTGV